jgi:Flp pilus assembly protein TadG
MVEMALVAPLLFLLVFGLIILGIAIANQIQLSNAVRDGARAAAICGGAGTTQAMTGVGSSTTSTLPNGASCTIGNLKLYINNSLALIPDASPNIGVLVNGSSVPADLSSCQPGGTVVVTASFQQPLYLPLVGVLIGDRNNSAVRTLTAQAQATCEQ